MFKNIKHKKSVPVFALFISLIHSQVVANTMEGQSMTLMETAITRHSGPSNYENPVDFQRNSHFNSTQTLQPGWNLNATAIGNLVNVQMSGAGNSVTINAMQINHGNQTAVISLYGGQTQTASNSTSEVKKTSGTYSTPSNVK